MPAYRKRGSAKRGSIRVSISALATPQEAKHASSTERGQSDAGWFWHDAKIVGGSRQTIISNLLLGDGLGILGGIFWAGTTLGIRTTRLSEAPPTKTLLYQLSGAAALLLPLAWWQGQGSRVWASEPWLLANLAFQIFVVAFASYLTWFWLMRRYLASRLAIFSFLTPLFGIAFGVLLLGEPLDPRFVLGAIFVLAGITVVNLK